jgi:hypothetical protein
MFKAREIAQLLKNMIKNGEFFLTEPVASLPKEGSLNDLEIRGSKRGNKNEED